MFTYRNVFVAFVWNRQSDQQSGTESGREMRVGRRTLFTMDFVSGAAAVAGASGEAGGIVDGFDAAAAAAVTMKGIVSGAGTGHDLTTVMSKGKHFLVYMLHYIYKLV